VIRVDQEQRIIDAITQQLGGQQAAGGGKKPGGGPTAGSGVFTIATTELTGYVTATGHLSQDLHKLAEQQVGSIMTIAEDSFGRIGKETGFAAALTHYADALRTQVSGVADIADKLGDAVNKTARVYQHQDQDLAQDILDLLT
jgi:hypothetical protein